MAGAIIAAKTLVPICDPATTQKSVLMSNANVPRMIRPAAAAMMVRLNRVASTSAPSGVVASMPASPPSVMT